MNKNILTGAIVGAVFCVAIVWGASYSALSVGGFVLLAAALDGLLGGLAIGWLIGANFVLRAVEEEEKKEVPEPKVDVRAAA
jgi:membrane associated rhomboid family serine protease